MRAFLWLFVVHKEVDYLLIYFQYTCIKDYLNYVIDPDGGVYLIVSLFYF